MPPATCYCTRIQLSTSLQSKQKKIKCLNSCETAKTHRTSYDPKHSIESISPTMCAYRLFNWLPALPGLQLFSYFMKQNIYYEDIHWMLAYKVKHHFVQSCPYTIYSFNLLTVCLTDAFQLTFLRALFSTCLLNLFFCVIFSRRGTVYGNPSFFWFCSKKNTHKSWYFSVGK